jgi:hypothetical protein
MNLNGLINMILHRVIGRMVTRGVDVGIDMAVGRGKDSKDMSPEERKQAKQGRELTGRAKQMAKIGRRL